MAKTTEPLDIVEITDFPGQPLAQIEQIEIRKLQREDPLLKFWIEAVRQMKLPPKHKVPKSKDHNTKLSYFNSLKLIGGILYRGVTIKVNLINQLVLQRQLIQSAITGLHNNMGHPGKDRTILLLGDRFFWTGINFYTENWIKNCNR